MDKKILEHLIDLDGIGEIQIEVGVDTASLPGTSDGDEEVTVTLEIVTFKAIATN